MRTRVSFPSLAAFILAGMAIPVLVALPLDDVLSLYITGRQYTYFVAAAFALVAWAVLAVWDLDRVDFLVAAVVLPWVGAMGLFFLGVATSGEIEGFRYLFLDIEDVFAYSGSFVVAGVAAVAIQRRAARLSERAGWPAPRRLAVGALVLIILLVVVGGGVAQVTASSASITAVEPGIADHRSAALNVTVDSAPAELRLTVTHPDGETVTKRVSGASMGETPTTIPVVFHRLGQPVAGTYHAELTTLPGITVDSATYTLETAPTPSLLRVETAGSGDTLRLDLPSNAAEYRPSPGPVDSNPRVGVVLQNDGDVAAEFDTRLLIGEEELSSRYIYLEPGQQGGNVLSLSVDDLERIHAYGNGTVTVEVAYRHDRVRTTVKAPER